MPYFGRTARSATVIAAMLVCPPNSPTKRPPGLSARATLAATASAFLIQCRTALLKTASNSRTNGSDSARSCRASTPRARAAATMSADASMPTTAAPRAAIWRVSVPSPHPRSSTRSPGRGSRRSTSGAPSAGTNAAWCAYCVAHHVCASALLGFVEDTPDLSFLAVGDVQRSVRRLRHAVSACDRLVRLHQRIFAREAGREHFELAVRFVAAERLKRHVVSGLRRG